MYKTADKFAQCLRDTLDSGTTEANVLFSVQPKSMGTLCFHANTIGMRLAQLLVLAKRGKDRHPLVDYDAELQLILNKKRFFSSAPGLQFANQRGIMLESLVKGQDATMLCTNYYGLQSAKAPRSRLWTVNVRVSKKRTEVHAVFGHCDILPALLYDIVSVDTMAHWFARELASPLRSITMYFHSLKGKGGDKDTIVHKSGITKMPETAEVYEALRLEEVMRDTRPNVAPVSTQPLPKELDKLLNEIHARWRKNGRKRT